MNKKKIWLACSKKGQVRAFTTYPIREEKLGVWLAESVGCISTLFMLFESDGIIEIPPLTWRDEPYAMEISITSCHEDEKDKG